ncbi:MAG: hypothetical protein EPO62_06785 [Candidatus Nitrosotenuis sp.]|nr:MAG: hypothetical protein EPO62_06785 [Candidatus Nitrosotenuis sp.]
MQTTKKPVNYQHLAILAIAAVLVAGIWIFGFDDELFGTKPIKSPIPQPVQQKSVVQNPTITQKTPSENLQSKPDATPTEKPAVMPEQKQVIQYATNKDPDLTDSLENSKFELDVDGTAYEGSPSLAKHAEITLKLMPIKGTKLEKFDVSDGRMIIGDGSVSFDTGTAEVKGTTISISVIHDDSLDPFFTITGTLDEPILSNKDSTQKVSFSDQLVYLGNKDDSTPHHFDVSGKLKH